MKKNHKILATLLASCLLFSQMPVFAETVLEETVAVSEELEKNSEAEQEFSKENFVKGEKNTFFAIPWKHDLTIQLDNVVPAMMDIWGYSQEYGVNALPKTSSPVEVAKRLKAYFESMPEGRRCFVYNEWLTLYISQPEFRTAGYWHEGIEFVIEHLDKTLSIYKRMGGPDIDIMTSDSEMWSIPWKVTGESGVTSAEVYDRLVNDPRYLTEIRPELEKLGFEFCYEEGKNELDYARQNMYVHGGSATYEVLRPGGKADNFLKLHSVMIGMNEAALYEGVYKVAKKHFPNILFGNYDHRVQPEEVNDYPVYSQQGYVFGYTRRLKSGNLGTDECYGWHFEAGLGVENFAPDYYYPKYHRTVFNSIRGDLLGFQTASMYTQNNNHVAWIGNYSWRWTLCTPSFTPGGTRYWDEFIFHSLMSTSQPFLFYYPPTTSPSDDRYLSETLYEIDEVLGFEERTPLLDRINDFSKDYLLTGMSAGGRHVWRVTPNLHYTDFTIEDFLYDEENMIFKIGNQFIDFPEGSFIYVSDTDFENRDISRFGYWVITPEGTYPTEYVDENLPKMHEPDILDKADYSHLTALNNKQSESIALLKEKQK